MYKFLFLILLSLLGSQAVAQSISVFDVKKNIPLTNTEPVFRDLYINAGSSSGLKKDMVVTVTRRNALYDGVLNRSAGEIILPVGKIKIIYAQKDLSVARFYSWLEGIDRPNLEFNEIMIGDNLDMASASMDKGDKPKSGHHADNESGATEFSSLSPAVSVQPAVMKPKQDPTPSEKPTQNLPQVEIIDHT
jgi:hypothetical protein